MNAILIIEDEEDVNLMLAEALRDAGYAVTSSLDGIDAWPALQSHAYDLVLLDLMLPFKSGEELLGELRLFSKVPVIVISAIGMVRTKIDLLRLGADDYITKPFDLGEVEARVASALRRSAHQPMSEPEGIHHYKSLTLDENSKQVTVQQSPLTLTAKEYQILEMLVKHKGKVFTKSNLYESIWEEDYLGDDNAVKVHISNLRVKLKQASPDEAYIETVWGLGYRLFKEGTGHA